MKAFMQNRKSILFLALSLTLLLGACEQEKQSSKKSSSATEDLSTGFPREKTLYMAGFQWGEPKSFNPLSDNPDFPVGGNYNLMYEPLLVFNTMTGKTEPELAQLESKNNDKISVIMNPAAKWSDQKAVTATDVKFTFELGKRFKNAPTTWIWDFISDIQVDSVDAGGVKSERVTFVVNKKGRNNPLVIMDILQGIRIVPAHVYEALLKEKGNDLSEVQKLKMDQKPVVSGAYTLMTYSNEKIVLVRRDDYWGNKALHKGKLPAPKYIVNPIYKSNDAFSTALQKGNLDISGTFIPRIWLKKKAKVHTWYSDAPYFIPSSIPMLTINVTEAPLSDPAFRRAMAHAINYQDIRELAVSGYSPDIQSGLILPFGVESKYFSKEDVAKYGSTFDIEKAKELLAKAGYKTIYKDDGKIDHMEDSKGNKLKSLSIKSPAGWSDWEASVKIAVRGMRKAGIDVREGFVDAGKYWLAQPTGDFDMIMNTPSAMTTPSQPWSRFSTIMSSRNWKPVGEKMNENQGRYNQPGSPNYNPVVDSLLKVIPVLTDSVEIQKAYRELNIIFMKDQPTLPLVYRPEQFYEFSVKHWENFATAENPYAPPQLPCFSAGTKMLWELTPVQ